MLNVLKSKIHRAVVTSCDLNYEGSITVDKNLMEKAGIHAYEQVDVLNINNGQRFTTYVIEGKRGSGCVAINGAAARLVQEKDYVIICCYKHIKEEDIKSYKPIIVLVDEQNRIKDKGDVGAAA